MKNHSLLLATIALLASSLPITSNAATQVYDLSADWSDTQNPNGPWSYLSGGGLLGNDPFPWVIGYNSFGEWDALRATTATTAVPGYLEVGDIFANSYLGLNVRWTAPANGTISISG